MLLAITKLGILKFELVKKSIILKNLINLKENISDKFTINYSIFKNNFTMASKDEYFIFNLLYNRLIYGSKDRFTSKTIENMKKQSKYKLFFNEIFFPFYRVEYVISRNRKLSYFQLGYLEKGKNILRYIKNYIQYFTSKKLSYCMY